ncbi:hypothetical protein ACRRTK_012048 [Alexandromys fortis]
MALRTGPRSRRAAGDPPAATPRPPRRGGDGDRPGRTAGGDGRGPGYPAPTEAPAALPYRVPPQSNSPPGTVPGAGRARPHARERALGARSESPSGLAPPPHRAPAEARRRAGNRGPGEGGGRRREGDGRPSRPPLSPGAAATPAAAGAIHGKGPARVQSRRRRRPPRAARGPPGGPLVPPPAAAAARPSPDAAPRAAPEERARAGRPGGEGEGGGGEDGPRARVRPPGAGGGGGASSSRGARPAPLRAPARPTQPLEPILIPKLRIRLADFPYLHCSNMPEAVHLGDLLRIWVRPGARFTPSPPDFQGPARAHRTPPEPRRFPRHGPLSRGEPIPGRPALHEEKRTLPGAPAGFSGIGRVTALDASRRPSPPLRIRGSEPDSLSIG